MHLMISIIGAILAIFIIIILHEMGHFFVARAFGVKILRFSIGFGRALYTKVDKNGTEYVLAAIPLGGYVKMLGETNENDIPSQERHRAFNRKPLLVRMAVVLAGPATNFVLAVLVFWAANLIGTSHIKPITGRVLAHSYAAKAGVKQGDYILAVGDKPTYNWQQVIMELFMYIGDPEPALVKVIPKGQSTPVIRSFDLATWKIDKRKPEIFKSIGMFPFTPRIPPIIQKVIPHSPAANAGMRAQDKIIKVQGKSINDDWAQVTDLIGQSSGKQMSITVQRAGKPKVLNVKVGRRADTGYLGVMVVMPKLAPDMIYTERYNVLTAWKPAALRAWVLFKYNLLVLQKLINAKLSFKVIGGPISIFQAAGEASHGGWEVYLSFIGFISLAVGFINLLPIPGLDGGHFLFQVIEALIRRPVPEKIQAVGFTVGMLFVLLIVLNATVNDLYRLFN